MKSQRVPCPNEGKCGNKTHEPGSANHKMCMKAAKGGGSSKRGGAPTLSVPALAPSVTFKDLPEREDGMINLKTLHHHAKDKDIEALSYIDATEEQKEEAFKDAVEIYENLGADRLDEMAMDDSNADLLMKDLGIDEDELSELFQNRYYDKGMVGIKLLGVSEPFISEKQVRDRIDEVAQGLLDVNEEDGVEDGRSLEDIKGELMSYNPEELGIDVVEGLNVLHNNDVFVGDLLMHFRRIHADELVRDYENGVRSAVERQTGLDPINDSLDFADDEDNDTV